MSPAVGNLPFLQVLTYLHVYSWYKRSEFGIRAAVFFSAATVSGAFGGLLAVCYFHTRALNPVTQCALEMLTHSTR